MRYCWCKAWGRNGGPGTSWNWGGAGRAVRGGWCAGGKWVARPVWGGWLVCPRGNSAEMGAWGVPRWKCRQEVAWLCWCLVKCAPMGNKWTWSDSSQISLWSLSFKKTPNRDPNNQWSDTYLFAKTRTFSLSQVHKHTQKHLTTNHTEERLDTGSEKTDKTADGWHGHWDPCGAPSKPTHRLHPMACLSTCHNIVSRKDGSSLTAWCVSKTIYCTEGCLWSTNRLRLHHLCRFSQFDRFRLSCLPFEGTNI